MISRKINIKLLAQRLAWIISGIVLCILFIFSVTKTDNKKCKGMSIKVHGSGSSAFVNISEIKNLVEATLQTNLLHLSKRVINLKLLETKIENSVWVYNADVYFDVHDSLRIEIFERKPILRIFDTDGNSFYLDTNCTKLSTTEVVACDIPILTNYTVAQNQKTFDKNNLPVLKYLVQAIEQNEFIHKLCGQIVYSENNNFTIIPKFGKFQIRLGDTSNLVDKFNKLEMFYKQIVVKEFSNRYHTIDIRFKNQIVAKRRGENELEANNDAIMANLQEIANNAALQSSDSIRMVIHDSINEASTEINIIPEPRSTDIDSADSQINVIEKPLNTNSAQIVNDKPTLQPNIINKAKSAAIKPNSVQTASNANANKAQRNLNTTIKPKQENNKKVLTQKNNQKQNLNNKNLSKSPQPPQRIIIN